MANEYDLGDRVEINTSTVFQDSDGSALDPDTVTFKVKKPGEAAASYVYDQDGSQNAAITKNGTGDYTLTIDIDTDDPAGDWYYRIEGVQDDGENRGADEGYFTVLGGNF